MKKSVKRHTELARKNGQIMEINVISISRTEVLTRVEDFISHSHIFYIVTPNPEIVLASQVNQKLKEALNDADLAIPDGVGLKIAIPGLKIIKGRELFLDLIKISVKNKWRVFLLGGLDNEAEFAANKLKNINPQLSIEFDSGPKLDNEAKPRTDKDFEIEKKVIDRINKFKPQLIFVAFGNPKQEIWIHKHISELKMGGAMCVGGAFRYLAGFAKLPPKWMSKIGLEWFWRGLTEPKRIVRILKAAVVFPLKYFIYKINH